MVSVLITRLLKGDVDHPAPFNCPECGSRRVATTVYPHNGEIHESGYCPTCEYPYFPEMLGHWSRWDADWSKRENKEVETVRDRRDRVLPGGGIWG